MAVLGNQHADNVAERRQNMSWWFILFIFVSFAVVFVSAYVDGYRSGVSDTFKKMEQEHDKAIAEYLEEMENKYDE